MHFHFSKRNINILIFTFFICVCIVFEFEATNIDDSTFSEDLPPTVIISILARNKAHTLPHFLGYLERLDYPKKRLSLWIQSDHSIDDTANVLNTWLAVHRNAYHSVDVSIDEDSTEFDDADGIFDWSPRRFDHIIYLRQMALKKAREMWADYIWLLDCDVFITNKNVLKLLIQEKKTCIAPMIESLGAYSNYWCGMTEKGYYQRTDDYLPILERENVGCFKVPMIHSAVLIDLHKQASINLTFNPKDVKGYEGPHDDIITFSHSTKSSNVDMFVLNKEIFGYMLPPLDKTGSLRDDRYQLINLKVEMLVDGPPMYTSPCLQHFVHTATADTLGMDEVYVINLERRSQRRKRMTRSLQELGIRAHVLNAVDGKLLNGSVIEEMGVKMLPEYADPYHKRPITKGEIGCFMSHFNVWKDMIAKQHRIALVLEDDLRFEPYFKKKVKDLIKETQKLGLLWDLIYLGRKRLSADSEPYVQGSSNLVHVDYSYWTLSYLITFEGAKKLVGANPLSKMVPVDEFLPIMFDRHPEAKWKGYYPKRNLYAFSAHPLLVYPTHYTGDQNYISDTEDSDIVIKTPGSKDEL